MLFRAKEFQPALVSLGANQVIAGANYANKVLYDGESLMVQLPSMLVSRSPYDLRGKFYVNVLVPVESVVSKFVNELNITLNGTPPIAKTTQDETGTYTHVRLRVTLSPLLEGTEGLHHCKVGHLVRAIARVDYVGCKGEWDLHLERVTTERSAHTHSLLPYPA